MNRRNFINSTVLAATVLPFSKVFGNDETAVREMLTIYPDREVLQQLENDFLKVRIYNDASMEITDKKRNQSWVSGPVAMQEEGPIDNGYVFNRTDRSFAKNTRDVLPAQKPEITSATRSLDVKKKIWADLW